MIITPLFVFFSMNPNFKAVVDGTSVSFKTAQELVCKALTKAAATKVDFTVAWEGEVAIISFPQGATMVKNG